MVNSYNAPFIFYTDDGANNTIANLNDTYASMGLGDGDDDTVIETKANLIATHKEKHQRGVMVMDIDTKEFKCIFNLTNGSSSIALDLSYKVLYVANDNNIIKLSMPEETEQLLYDDPYAVKEKNRFSNTTFVKNLNSTVGTIALDLRLKHRHIYWSLPGKFGEWDGRILRASLDNLKANGEAKNVIDLTHTINAGLEDISIAGTSMTAKVKGGLHNPTGLALDLRKPHYRLYWLDTGTNISTSKNHSVSLTIPHLSLIFLPYLSYILSLSHTLSRTLLMCDDVIMMFFPLTRLSISLSLLVQGTYLDGRLFRSNLDGTQPEIVLDYGYLKSPIGMVLDLVNNTAFVGDSKGQIWAIDMDFRANENQNVSKVLNKPVLLFSGPISYGELCPNCDTGVVIKVRGLSTLPHSLTHSLTLFMCIDDMFVYKETNGAGTGLQI